MMIDYAPIVRESIHGTTHQSGLGEFFALPIFTCVGLMWMASAIDFVMIFVSLEAGDDVVLRAGQPSPAAIRPLWKPA